MARSLNRGRVRLIGIAAASRARASAGGRARRNAGSAGGPGRRGRSASPSSGLLLPNQWPQSSRCRPYWVWPLSASNSPVSGRNRKSRPLMATVLPVLIERTRPAAVAVGAVDPAVEAELEAVEPVLLVALAEAGEQHLAMVGLAVAVAVLGIEDVRAQATSTPLRQGMSPAGSRGRRGTSSTCRTGRRRRCPRGYRTTPAGFPLPSAPSGIIPHLDDPEPAVGAPVEGDRVLHQRLAARPARP